MTEGEAEELVALNHWVHTGPEVPAPDEMRHLVVMPVANEDYSIITESLDEILATDYRMDRVMLCLTFEERSKVWTTAVDLPARGGLPGQVRHGDDHPAPRRTAR